MDDALCPTEYISMEYIQWIIYQWDGYVSDNRRLYELLDTTTIENG